MRKNVQFQVLPNASMVRVNDVGDIHWRAVGKNAGFHCMAPELFPLRGGWYRLDLSLKRQRGKMVSPVLLPDFGSNTLETLRIRLPSVARGGNHCIVRFVSDVHALRLEPSVSSCDFTMRGPGIRRVGRLQAFADMFGALLQRRIGLVSKMRLVAKAMLKLASHGIAGLGGWLYTSYAEAESEASSTAYADWIDLYDPACNATELQVSGRIASLVRRPFFSIVMPVYNTDEPWLRACIDSVLAQAYPEWELCIADDASPSAHVRKVLEEYILRDPRIRVTYRSENGHISAASNTALDMAKGDYVVLLDHDDELHPMALLAMAEAVSVHPEWRVIYSDEDKIDADGQRYDPYFKADFNYDLFLGQNCISHLGVYETVLLREIGGFRLGLEGSQDWDLALRCIERVEHGQIGHVPHVLYHWRAIPGSTALSGDQKGYAQQAGYKAVSGHVQRVCPDAIVESVEGQSGFYRVRYPVPSPSPKVSLIVPTRDRVDLLRMCVNSILSITDYDNYEIVIVDNGSVEQETLDYFERVVSDSRVCVLSYPKPFNYSAINNFAVTQTDAVVVGLVNNDIEAISPDWLREMVSHALRPEIGAVGALLYYPNNTVQHAGVVTGLGGVAGHTHHGLTRGSWGYFCRMGLAQSYSCVTAACLLIRRSVFEQVGGLDERLQVAFNDVDFCLRVREAGYRNLWTPFAELYHHESASRGHEDTPAKQARFQSEVDFMRSRWGDSLDHDPAYNPNLSLTTGAFQLAFPPRSAANR